MIYLLSILFTFLFVFYSKHQFIDDKGGPSGKWHGFGMAIRISMFIIPFIMQYFSTDWTDYLLAGTINIFLWEILINKIALDIDWFHIGITSKLDIRFNKTKWFIYGGFILIALIIKLYFNQIYDVILKLIN